MKRNNTTTISGLRRTRLSIAVGGALCAGMAAAQDVSPGPAGVEEVTVTGSRITRDGMNSPTPITAITAEDMQMMAPGQFIDSLDYLPPFFMNDAPDTAASKSQSAGAANVNLRGLGANRTLVLLDGRRMVPSNRLGAVDINLFPEAMVERVEVVTGGASAVYGTDAVAGVVNFILKDDFEGFDIHTQAGVTDRDDGEHKEVSVAYGTDIGERGHLMASAEWYDAHKIETLEGRDWFQHWGLIQNPGAGPRDLVRPDVVSYTYTAGGLINSTLPGADARRRSNSDGDPSLRVPARRLRAAVRSRQPHRRKPGDGPPRRARRAAATARTKSRTAAAAGTRSRTAAARSCPRPSAAACSRTTISILSDTTTLYAQVLAGNNEVNSVGTLPLGIAGWAGTIYSGNPFLPANIQQLMTANNIPSFLLERYHTTADLAHDRFITDNDTRSLTFGADAEIQNGAFEGWTLGGYAQLGTNDNQITQVDFIRTDRLPEAMDAVRHPVDERDRVPRVAVRSGQLRQLRADQSCSASARASQTAIDYVLTGDQYILAETDQKVVEFSMEGDIGDGWGAGAISLAFGGGWRDESIDQTLGPDDIIALSMPLERHQCCVHEQHRGPVESAGGLHAASAACRRSSRPRRTRSSSSRTCSRSRASTRSRKRSSRRCCRSSPASRASSSSISPSRRATRTTKARAASGPGRPASTGRSTTRCGCARRCRATFARRRCRSGSIARVSAAPSTTRSSAA